MNDQSTYTISVFEHNEQNEIVDFIKETSRPSYSPELFKWQYSHPNSSLNIIREHEKLRGTQGMIYTELKFGKHNLHSHKSETTFLNDSLRGKGQFEKLYGFSVNEAIRSGTQLIWGFTALGTLWEKKLHFKCDNQLVFEANLIVNQISSIKGMKRVYYLGKAIRNGIKRITTPLKNCTCEEFDLSKELSILHEFESFYKDDAIYLDYFSETVQNRVFDSPLIKYRFLKLNYNGRPEAIVIYHISKNQFIISEFIYKNETTLTSIVKKVIRFALEQKHISNIRFWGNKKNHRYAPIFFTFAKFGGKIIPVDNMQLVYKPIDDKLLEIDPANYYINGLWTEGFTY